MFTKTVRKGLRRSGTQPKQASVKTKEKQDMLFITSHLQHHPLREVFVGNGCRSCCNCRVPTYSK